MELRRGQKLPLPPGRDQIVVSVEAAPVEQILISVVPLDESRRGFDSQITGSGRVPAPTLISFEQVGTTQRFTVDLRRFGPGVARLALTAHRPHGPVSEVRGLTVSVQGIDFSPLATLKADQMASGDEAAVVMLEVYRRNGWRIAAVGQGFTAGLPALAAHLGVDPSLLSGRSEPPAPIPVISVPPPRQVPQPPAPVIAPPPRAGASHAVRPPGPPARPADQPPPRPATPPTPAPIPGNDQGKGYPVVPSDFITRLDQTQADIFQSLSDAARLEGQASQEAALEKHALSLAHQGLISAANHFFDDFALKAKTQKAPEPAGVEARRFPGNEAHIKALANGRDSIQELAKASRLRRRLTRRNATKAKEIRAKAAADVSLADAERQTTLDAELHRIRSVRQRETDLSQAQWQRQAAVLDEAAPAWADPRWQNWAPSAQTPPAIRVGTATISQGLHSVTGPAALSLGAGGLLLWGTGSTSTGLVQDMMLRLLAEFPPGKARFVLVDPQGSGEAFAPYLHLSDFDDRLIGTKVWTDPRDIEQQMAELQSHVELVIQRYLRGEYDTIEEHNRDAGEVAEAYRFPVIVGFPHGFNDQSAQRLVSLARNGPRCGVTPIVVADPTAPMPHGFDIKQLSTLCRVWTLDRDKLMVRKAEMPAIPGNHSVPAHQIAPTTFALRRDLPGPELMLTEPHQPSNAFTTVMRGIGSRSKAATNVQVSMERLTELASALMQGGRTERLPTAWPLPTPADPGTWWHGSTAESLSAIVGRVGAQGVQSLHLSGSDTAVHALIAGRTGSGKSSLLHATILALATTYSPDEVEMFLLDFKEGVEFKPYADLGLPHARVVAIESEREFGLSVLQNLEAELSQRGASFRQSGSTGLAAHRAATGRPLPRMVLLIDEFHRLFPDEDKIAVECARILDLLVRQGRSFGIHVVLASQSLSGVAQVGRGTFSQIGVRVALQCEDADSRLIFNDENPDASRLERAGDAIMNTANGRREANDPFQVVWVPAEQREAMIRQLRHRADAENYRQRPVVFEGNAAADLTDCRELVSVLRQDQPYPADTSLWIGAPISLGPPEPLQLRRRVGAHVLVVGSDDELCGGAAVAAALSLAGQLGSGPERRLTLLDFGALDDPVDVAFSTIDRVTGPGVVAGRRTMLTRALTDLASEVERRMDRGGREPSMVLLAHRLHAARDLRPDDYGSDGPTPHDLLATILREGPEVGVHVVATTDGISALARRLDDRLIEEMGHIVCFRTSADESLRLLDSDQAAHLKGAQALVLDRDAVTTQKVRAFRAPDAHNLEALLGLGTHH